MGKIFSKMFNKPSDDPLPPSSGGFGEESSGGGGGFFSRFLSKKQDYDVASTKANDSSTIPYDESPFDDVIKTPTESVVATRSAPPPPPPPPQFKKVDDVIKEAQDDVIDKPMYENLSSADAAGSPEIVEVTSGDQETTPSRPETEIIGATSGEGSKPDADVMSSSSSGSSSENDGDDDKEPEVIPEEPEVAHVEAEATPAAEPAPEKAPSVVVAEPEAEQDATATIADDVIQKEEVASVDDVITETNQATTSSSSADHVITDDVAMTSSNNDIILPPHYMYTVQAQHPYNGDDDDELTFAKGEIIYVVEFPDPDEQDEGWQMGVLKSGWEDGNSDIPSTTKTSMGLFPENFTKRIN